MANDDNFWGRSQRGVPGLLSICRLGRRFYGEAAEGSKNSRQSLTLLNVELQRALLVQELEHWAKPRPCLGSNLVPLVRSARHDDRQILSLCDRMDQETIAAYQLERSQVPAGLWRAMLDRHLAQIAEGRARLGALLQYA